MLMVLSRTSSAGEVRLLDIQLEGTAFEDGEFSGKQNGLVIDQTVQTDSLLSIISRIDSLLAASPGFPFRKVTGHHLEYSPDSSAVKLVLHVEDGAHVVFSNPVYTGTLPGDALNYFHTHSRIRSGDEFSQGKVDEEQEMILEYFESRGYPFARVAVDSLVPEMDKYPVQMTVVFHVTGGRRIRINAVHYAGIKRTRPELLERIGRLDTLRFYDPHRFTTIRKRLIRTGWFESVSEPLLVREDPAGFGISYRIREKRTNRMSGIIGYSPNEKSKALAGNLDLFFGHILGTGRDMELHWLKDGGHRQQFALRYHEPFVFGLPLHTDFELSQLVEDTLFSKQSFRIRETWEFSDSWNLQIAGSLQMSRADSSAGESDSLRYTLQGYDFILEYFGNGRNSQTTNPLHIRLGSMREIVISGELDGLQKYEVDLEFTMYPVHTMFITNKIHLRSVLSDKGNAPYSEWYRAGGASTVRGYLENTISGSSLFWHNLEWGVELDDMNRIFLFTDLAFSERLSEKTWYHALGGGLTTMTRLGRISVAAGVPISEGFTAMVIHTRLESTF